MVRTCTCLSQCDTCSCLSSEYYVQVLAEYSDEELRSVMDVASGIRLWVDSSVISHYKEVQIHGPLILSKNVEALVVNYR